MGPIHLIVHSISQEFEYNKQACRKDTAFTLSDCRPHKCPLWIVKVFLNRGSADAQPSGNAALAQSPVA